MDWINLCLLSLSLWAPAGADVVQAPAPPPPPPAFEGSAEFSYVGTSGNSDTRSLGAGTALTFRPHAWTITSKAAVVRSEDSGVVKAQSAVLSTLGARQLTERASMFASHEYLRNRFAGISSRNAVEAGLAYSAMKNARQELAFKVGIGYATEHRLVGPNRSSGIGTAGATYRLTLSDSAVVEDELQTVTALDKGRDQRVTNVGNLTATLTTVFSLKVRHTTRWVRTPVPGFRRTDTTTAVALVAKF